MRDIEGFVLDGMQGVFVVQFYADNCSPCEQLKPVMEDIEKQMPEVSFSKMKVFDMKTKEVFHAMEKEEYAVTTFPTVCIFKDGKLKEKIVGVKPQSFIAHRIACTITDNCETIEEKPKGILPAQIDLNKLSMAELKALAYDHILLLQDTQRKIQTLEALIQQKISK